MTQTPTSVPSTSSAATSRLANALAERLEAGANALAAPVLDASGTLVATIAILNSVQFIEHKPADDQVRRVLGAAQRISRRLGYGG